MHQVLFRLPWLDIPVYSFGMMLFAAFVVCTWVSGRQAEKEGIAKEHIQDLAMWLFLGGILGARVTFLIAEDLSPWQMLRQVYRIWDGGLILYGSFVGGLLGYLGAYHFVLRKHGIPTWKMIDVIAPSVAVGICLGRVGCLLNGCCYGHVACANCPKVDYPLSAPARYLLVRDGYQTAAGFTIASREPVRVDAVEPGSPAAVSGLKSRDQIVEVDGRPVHSMIDLSTYLADSAEWTRGKADLQLTVVHAGQEDPVTLPAFKPRTLALHPTQVYESISMALLFFLLMALYPFRRHDGEVMALGMVCYGIHRYVNELLRFDPRPGKFESYVSLLLIGSGVLLGLWLWRKPILARPASAVALTLETGSANPGNR